MLNFSPVTFEDAALLRGYYENCRYTLCEYSVGTKLMWKDYLHPVYTETAGCLIVRNRIDDEYVFDCPVPGPDGDMEQALAEIEKDCVERGIPLVLSVVPEEMVLRLIRRYPHAKVDSIGAWKDYLYQAENMITFAGRHYAGQRNHINKFCKTYPEARFRPLGPDDEALLRQFWETFDTAFGKDTNPKAVAELGYAKALFARYSSPWFCAGGVEYQGQLIAVALAERCGETLIIHIEKALRQYSGVYPFMVNRFAQHFACDGITILNREDDASDMGLRISKSQYLPTARGAKYRLRIRTQLDELTVLPELTSPALSYRAGISGEPGSRRLFFSLSSAVSGQSLFSCCIQRFDFRGGAEMQVELLRKDIGEEVLLEGISTIANWALYQFHLEVLYASCSQDDGALLRCFASCFRKRANDEQFAHFEKRM